MAFDPIDAAYWVAIAAEAMTAALGGGTVRDTSTATAAIRTENHRPGQ